MGKVILWIVVVFAVLVVLRLVNTAKARRRAQGAAPGKPATAEPMVRCVRCGVYLPRLDAKPSPQGPICGDPKCLESR